MFAEERHELTSCDLVTIVDKILKTCQSKRFSLVNIKKPVIAVEDINSVFFAPWILNNINEKET